MRAEQVRLHAEQVAIAAGVVEDRLDARLLLDGQRGVIRDLWKQEDIADFQPACSYVVQPHNTALLRIVTG